jgi:type IV fimbrial biogenesis protein FimT
MLVNTGSTSGRAAGHPKETGFTLIEAMVVIAILGILVALAAPSFNNTIATMRIKSISFDLVNDLNTARSEAIKRNADVVISAVGGEWKQGWSITTDTIATGTITLKSHEPLSESIAVESAVTAINFQGNGRPNAETALTITSTLTGVSPRCVKLQASGSAQSEVCPS